MGSFLLARDGCLQIGLQAKAIRSVRALYYSPPSIDRILPLMLEQCKMKSEDFEKFKKDQMQADVLEKKKQI